MEADPGLVVILLILAACVTMMACGMDKPPKKRK